MRASCLGPISSHPSSNGTSPRGKAIEVSLYVHPEASLADVCGHDVPLVADAPYRTITMACNFASNAIWTSLRSLTQSLGGGGGGCKQKY